MISLQQTFSQLTPTITAALYNANECIGGLLTFVNPFSNECQHGDVNEVMILDKAAQGKNLILVLFRRNPTTSTISDKTAFAPSDADLLNITAVIPVGTHNAFVDNGTSYGAEICRPVQGLKLANSSTVASTVIYGALVAVETPTYTSTSDVTVRISIKQD